MFYGCEQTVQFIYILKKTLKFHQYGYLMKGLGLGSKNMLGTGCFGTGWLGTGRSEPGWSKMGWFMIY
jgi:hypothetical protein